MKIIIKNLQLLFKSDFIPNKLTIILFIFLTLLGSFLKIFSIVSLFPLLEKLTNNSSNTDNFFFRNLNKFFELLSVDKSFSSVATLIVILLLFKFCVDMLSVKFFERTMVNLSLQIRKSLTKNLFKLDFESFEKIKNNELISILQDQVDRVRAFFRNSVTFITHILESMIYLFSSFLINFPLTLLAFFLGFSKFIILKKVHLINQKLGKDLTKMQMEDNKSIIDTLSSMKFLRFMNKEKFGTKKIIVSRINLDEVERKNLILFRFLKNFNELLNLFFIGVFLTYGFSTTDDINEVIILILFLNKALGVFSQIQRALYKMETSYDAVSVIDTNIKEWKKKNDFVGKKVIKKIFSFKLNNVTIKSGKKVLFKNLNLTFPANKIYKIVGDSGVGKTIFIESLLGLRKIDSGKILIGNDILESKNIDLSKWFENIGYISNNPTFFNDSLFNNLQLGDNTIKKKIIFSFLDKFNLRKTITNNQIIELNSKNSGMSLGQYQRLQIIRGIIHSKKILFIDEGLSNVESELRNKILKSLSKLKHKLTIFSISHTHNINENKFFDYQIKITNENIKLTKISKK